MLPYVSPRFLKAFKILCFICVCSIFIFHWRLKRPFEPPPRPRFPPQTIPLYECECEHPSSASRAVENFPYKNASNPTEDRALLLVENIYSRHARFIIQVLNSTKFPYKLEPFSKNLPLLTTATHGRFSVIIIENYYKYLNLARWNRQLLDKYCKDYGVSILSFVSSRSNDQFSKIQIKGSKLAMWQNQKASSLRFSNFSSVPYIAKPGAVLGTPTPDDADWVLFEENTNFESVLLAKDSQGRPRVAIIRDTGLEDGIDRILFGQKISHWIVRLAFLDSLRFATRGNFGFSLSRVVQIDIDDIFVGSRGTRVVESDVRSIVVLQHELATTIENFRFTLGFSGSYFRNGDDNEDRADELLIELANNFIWFPHMWRHNHAHEHNLTYLEAIMTQNKLFAKNMNLSIPFRYSISPQHDGVFPVHEDLYEAWRRVWNITVTATEEYPHLKPSGNRRGFVHRGVSVLPRQTCGLYTHTQFFHTYPDGLSKLVQNGRGGELFFTLLYNPISFFMTHQQNYAHDRLAAFTFKDLLRFVTCWTRLELKWIGPEAAAKKYFELFPSETTPVWSNPCSDSRHQSMLPPALNCSDIPLPSLLIVGPQKTGTTALASFLALNPRFSSNRLVPGSFEEPQFFGGIHYNNGLAWYISLFKNGSISNDTHIFEKSATYFDNPAAPRQAFSLLPKAKILIVLSDPSRRAYSWFQHQLAHNDTAAMEAGSMDLVLDALDDKNSSFSLRKLAQRCLNPGRYTRHIDRWLEHFPAAQLIFVDGEILRDAPVKVMNSLMEGFGIVGFDYQDRLTYDSKKGFYCSLINGQANCLGKGKGRKYAPMPESLEKRLNMIFLKENLALHKMLLKYDWPVPRWLSRVLSNS